LVELTITMAVGVILLLLATPSFRELTMRGNVKELANELSYALNLARSEAVRRGTQVKVLSTSSGASWNGGWTVLADTAFDGTFATTISQQAGAPATYTVCGFSTGGGSSGAVIYNSSGFLSGASAFDFNVNRPDANVTRAQRVSVLSNGEIRSQMNTTGSPAAPSC
jgi:type IV fimbrial biogenesis protein FimT